MGKMTVEEMIEHYAIFLDSHYDYTAKKWIYSGKIIIRAPHLIKSEADKKEIADRKPEIVQVLKAQIDAQEKAYKARREKIEAIDGLKEIQGAINRLNNWWDRFNASFAGDCGGLGVGQKPKDNIDEMKAKYPRAAAYLKAEEWSLAASYAKAAAGKKAMEKIIDGEDYNDAIAAMEKEWDDHVQKHIWD